MSSALNSMAGRVCMVSGANSRIGKATALGLPRMRATVVAVSGKGFKRTDSLLQGLALQCYTSHITEVHLFHRLVTSAELAKAEQGG